jgi:predicted short-subunit dehydrogenase-like oxidoreductase (DUF2520 family)
MRELERTAADSTDPRTAATADPLRVAVVGRGRVGAVMARALRQAGHEVEGPLGRDERPEGRIDVLLHCVPDAAIPAAAGALAGCAAFVGHTSGATPLTVLEAAGGEAFGLHPLQTIAGPGSDLRGCGCAIAGRSAAARELATRLAVDLGMRPVEIADRDRPAYHAAASVASNFLLTLEAAAERIAAGAGIGAEDARRLLGPLVLTTVENWLALGPEAALTGPVARGDEATIAAQRAAVEETAPELLPLFDLLVERTALLAGRVEVAA